MTVRENAQAESSLPSIGWLLAAALLLALRLPHLGGPLDDPHSWRQCDTVHYSLDFYRNGIDLLHPAVCWLGSHRTLIFEFPLPEAMSAVLYRMFGPGAVWDRVVALGFYLVAVLYLFAWIRAIAGRRVAWLATLAYLALPLGQYYSRAAQVDFAASAFAHGLLFHATVAIQRRSFPHAAAAAGCGTLAAMMKAPYLIPVLGPLAMVALAMPSIATAGLGAIALGVPAIAFRLWRGHVDAVNATAPDWNFLPGYYKEVNPLWWYVGSWAQRLEAASWIRLARRLIFEVATPLGALFGGLALLRRGGSPFRFGPTAFALAWSAAALAYLLVFFPLNVIHNYYQVPFLAPVAMLIGLGADFLWERLPLLGRVPAGAVAFAAFVVVSMLAVRALGYYRIDWLRVEAGRMIDRSLPRGDLIVVTDHSSGYSDPRLLVRADRAGWPLAMADLEAPRLERLASLGARWVAVVTDPGHPGLGPPAYLEPHRISRAPVLHGGDSLGTLSLYRLDPGALAHAANGAVR